MNCCKLSGCFTFVFRPGGIPAKNSKGERLLLYLGVIDILQRYKLRKKFEHTIKSMVTDGVSKIMDSLIHSFVHSFVRSSVV